MFVVSDQHIYVYSYLYFKVQIQTMAKFLKRDNVGPGEWQLRNWGMEIYY